MAGVLSVMSGSERLGRNPADGMSGSIDAEQRRERYGQVYRFGMRAVSSRLERKAVESQRHMRIVSVGRCMIGSIGNAYGIWSRNAHHIPSTQGRITVLVLQSGLGVGHLALGQLGARVVASQANLLQGFAHGTLRVFLLQLDGGKRVF